MTSIGQQPFRVRFHAGQECRLSDIPPFILGENQKIRALLGTSVECCKSD